MYLSSTLELIEDAATFLTRWKADYGLTDKAAAKWCRISVSAFRRQRSGRVPDSRCQQTVALAEFYPIHRISWLDVAETAMKVGLLTTKSP